MILNPDTDLQAYREARLSEFRKEVLIYSDREKSLLSDLMEALNLKDYIYSQKLLSDLAENAQFLELAKKSVKQAEDDIDLDKRMELY